MKKCKSEGCQNEKYGASAYCSPCKNSKQRYGLSVPDRQLILENQGHKCLICNSHILFDGENFQSRACVDHDHKTGSVRGIICRNCNTWLGYLENKNIALSTLQEYLNK